MELINVYVVLFVLGAAPVIIYLFRMEDSLLSAVFGVLALCYMASFFASIYWLSYLQMVAFGLIPYLLHWFVWIRATVKKTDVKTCILPNLTVFLVLLYHASIFGNLITLIVALVYMVVSMCFYGFRKKRELAV